MKFKQITIIGVGLLGGSFALAMRARNTVDKIVGVSRRLSSAENALSLGVIDEATDDIKQAVKDADLVLIATPMLSMRTVLQQVTEVVSPDCLITDVGSVKGTLVDMVQSDFPQLLPQFVFAHPIAGGERSGANAARADLFADKHLILAATHLAKPEFVAMSQTVWRSLGAKVVEMSAEQHDAVFAYTSHLPHVIAYALVNNLHQQGNSQQLFDFASAGFYDFTRIASSDPIMWRDICLSNKKEVLKSVRQFSEQLSRLEQAIEHSDAAALKKMFNDAKQARDEGLIKKQR